MVHQPGRAHFPSVHRHRDSALERNFHIGGLVRGGFWRDRQDEHVLGRLRPGIFQNASFVGNVQQVPVTAVGLLARHQRNGDAVFLGVIEHRFPGIEDPVLVLPGGDDADRRVQGDVGQLEPDLVVSLPGCAVTDRIRPLQMGDFDLPFGDQRPRQGRAQQVGSLVDCVGSERREDEIPGEFLPQVVDIDFAGAGPDRLSLQTGELLFLADIRGEGDDLTLVGLDEPLDNHRRVQSPRVSENDLFESLFQITTSLKIVVKILTDLRSSGLRLRAHRQACRKSPIVNGTDRSDFRSAANHPAAERTKNPT